MTEGGVMSAQGSARVVGALVSARGGHSQCNAFAGSNLNGVVSLLARF